MTRIHILGVPVDCLTADQAVERIRKFLSHQGQHHVMTPNPEMLVEASRNPGFRTLLQTSDLNLPDGVGLLWAARRLGKPLPERVTGTDVLPRICALPEVGPVFLLGAAPGVAKSVADILRHMHPSLVIAGTHAGSPNSEDEWGIMALINASGARTLFVAYGAPAQDLWIRRNLSKMPGVRLAMGVGGAFDFIAGVQTRAPLWLRQLGLEWVSRLVRQPSRIGRIINATLIFPLLVLRHGEAPVRPSAASAHSA